MHELLLGSRGSRCPGFSNHSLNSYSTWVSVAPTLGSVLVALELTGSVLVVPRLSCSMACGILLDQGWNLGPLHWQPDSYPPYHQESLILRFFFFLYDVWNSSKFIFWPVHQHQLLKRHNSLSFAELFLYICKKSAQYLCLGSILVFSVLFHWSMCLSLWQ